MQMIPLVDLKAQYGAIGPEIEAAIARVLERQSFINAAETRAFEEEFAAFCEAPEAIGVSNGTTAIELILNALGVQEHVEVPGRLGPGLDPLEPDVRSRQPLLVAGAQPLPGGDPLRQVGELRP